MNNFETPLVDSLEHRITRKANKQAEDLLVGVKDAVAQAYMEALSAYTIPEEDARDHIVRHNVDRCHRDIERALSSWIVGDIIKDVTDQLVPMAPTMPEPQPEPEPAPLGACDAAITEFKPGERVQVTRAVESHSEGWDDSWTDSMDSAIGREGVVIEDRGKSGVSLKFEGGPSGFNFPRHALLRVPAEAPAVVEPKPFQVGDCVWITGAKKFSPWVDDMNSLIGLTGKITEIYEPTGDCWVNVDGSGFYYNPADIEHAPS